MFPLLNRSTYSILQSAIKIKPLIEKAKEYGYSQLGLIDINTLGGVYDFIEECNKNDIMPVIGAEFSTIDNNHKVIYVAKNLQGWKSLLKLNTLVQANEYLTLEDVEKYKEGLMCWVMIGPSIPFAKIFKTDLLTFTTVDLLDVRYLDEQYREDYLLVRCSERKTHLNELIVDFPGTHFPNKEELEDVAECDSIEYARLLENIEPINLKHDPILPSYNKGEFESEIALLRHLCREGWKRRYRNSWNTEVYGERVKHELSVIEEFDMAGYFLIVQDLVNYGKQKGWLFGSSRGSAGGSLVSYLIGITETDPIPHKLLFERFVNPDRKGTLPDIDIDVPPNKREILIQYLRDKYGKASVAQIITFGTLKGKNVLKEVLRNSGACDFVTANTITKHIPQEAKIIDLMKADKETSIVRWVLKNQPKVFDGYCKLTEEGEYVGEYAKYFEQAVRLEGIIKSVGVHAAGIIVTRDNVDDYFPLFKHDSGEMIAAMEYPHLEAMSGCKIDLLGVAALQKLDDINKMLVGKL